MKRLIHWMWHALHWHMSTFDAAEGVSLNDNVTVYRCKRCKYVWHEDRPTYADLFGKVDSKFWARRYHAR